jgi:quercetin dioxygenase-like cupin family protein
MKLDRMYAILLGTLAVTGILWTAGAQDKQEKKEETKAAVFVSADEAKFKEIVPGVSKVVLTGDPDKGPYSAFTKFAPGLTNALHTHTSPIRIVVIKGAYIYKPEKGQERRVGAGCFLDVPAGDRHTSSGDAKDGALFFEESTGKFDLVPVEKK